MAGLMTSDERDRFAEVVLQMYTEGRSIRQIAVATGRAYGTVRRMLLERGMTMRSRGRSVDIFTP